MIAQAYEALAERTLAVIDGPGRSSAFYTWAERRAEDRERVASDLAGLQRHAGCHYCVRQQDHCSEGGCPDAIRYAEGLRRTAALYGVAL